METRTFNLKRDYHSIGRKLYKQSSVTFHTGVTVLVGCNGCGKTTMLTQVAEQLEKDNIELIQFDNLTQGGDFARDRAGFMGDMNFIAQSLCSSEGENIMLNMVQMAGDIAKYVKRIDRSGQNELWILMDAVDSGFSVDNVDELKKLMFQTILDDQKDKDVYFLVTANEYEMARGENCMDVPACQYRTFSDYEDYRDYILKTRKRKDGRKRKSA